MYYVDNAIIMAAETSSCFVPFSYEKPKALVNVTSEVLIEQQILHLKESGIKNVYIIAGYKQNNYNTQ